MENTEKSRGEAVPPAYIDLEDMLQKLNVLCNCMDQLELRAQLRLCDLIVCVGHPDKLAFQKVQEALKQEQQPPSML